MSRITWRVQDVRGRFRAEVSVDDHPVRHKWFDSYTDAQQWCMTVRDELMREVKEFV